MSYESDTIKSEEILDNLDEMDDLSDDENIDEEEEDIKNLNTEMAGENIINEIWSEEKIRKLIELRKLRENVVIAKGYNIAYTEILHKLEMANLVTASDVKRKWTSLLRHFMKIKDMLDNNDGEIHITVETEEDVQMVTGIASGSSWPFYDQMKEAVDEIIKVSPNKTNKYLWPHEVLKKFINLIAIRHNEMSTKGQNVVYEEILKTLGIEDMVTVSIARKKWNYLIRKYEDEHQTVGKRRWKFYDDMTRAVEKFKGMDEAKLRSKSGHDFLWTTELTKQFIDLRIAHSNDFYEYGLKNTYMEILVELQIDHVLNPLQLRKRWNYLVEKFKDFSNREGPSPHLWPFYSDMQKAMTIATDNSTDGYLTTKSYQEFVWTKEVILKFINFMGSESLDTPEKVLQVCTKSIDELGLNDTINPNKAKKKWDYLTSKYLDLSDPSISEDTKLSWPYYSAMRAAIESSPISQIHQEQDFEMRLNHNGQYTCFVCQKEGQMMSEFYIFRKDQKLLHTHKNVTDIIGHLVSRKFSKVDPTTCLCSRCTNLINEADNVMGRHDKLREEAKTLYFKNGQRIEEVVEDPVSVQVKLETETKTENITYSKRGRKRKSTIIIDDSVIKSDSLDDFESIECDVDFDDFDSDYEKTSKPKKLKMKSGKGKKKSRGISKSKSKKIPKTISKEFKDKQEKKSTIYYCSECDSQFTKHTDMILHKREAHKVVDTTPLKMEETILENGVITYFNKTKTKCSSTSYPCKDCDKFFLRKDDLAHHKEIAHTDGEGKTKNAFKNKSYICQECGEIFLFKYKLNMHIKIKHLNDVGVTADDFTCGECGCKLGSLAGLTFHQRRQHNKVLAHETNIEFLCSDCGFMAPSSKKLREHQDAHCGSLTKQKEQCEICGKTVQKKSMRLHKKKMHFEYKEQCDRCEKKFATKNDLLRHVNTIHLGMLLYNCRICGERFANTGALQYHKVKNHETRIFYCEMCSKSYKRVSELNRHIKSVHSENRKGEICTYCGKEFYDRSNLRNHLVKKHNVPREMTYTKTYLKHKYPDGPSHVNPKHTTTEVITKELYSNVEKSQVQVQTHTHLNDACTGFIIL